MGQVGSMPDAETLTTLGGRLYVPHIRDKEDGSGECLLPRFTDTSRRMSWDLNLGQHDYESLFFSKPSHNVHSKMYGMSK